MGYGLLRLFAFRCLAAHSRRTGPSFCGNFDGKMITSMGWNPVLEVGGSLGAPKSGSLRAPESGSLGTPKIDIRDT